jgi:hypothetical protein
MAYNYVIKESSVILIRSGKFDCDCHLFPALKQKLGGHKFKDDCEMATV